MIIKLTIATPYGFFEISAVKYANKLELSEVGKVGKDQNFNIKL